MHKIQERKLCEALDLNEKGRASWQCRGAEENPHIRNNRDGTVIKLDVNNGAYTMDTWVCLDETGPVFQLARTVSGSSVTNKPVRPGTKCSSGGEECQCKARVERFGRR